MARHRLTVDDYVAGIRNRDRAVLGRALTLVESRRAADRELAAELLSRLLPLAGSATRVGISGVPGVGKSSFIEALGCRLLEAGQRVAVLAVDPSSAVTGGSILGDKTRMERLATAADAFIRPSPAGGSLGGVARTTREMITVCEAAGFDVVLVETVGVGQSETMVAEMVDTFLVLMLAGAGDELQGIKRGILELADVIAINKADGPNLERTRRARAELERALQILRPAGAAVWTVRVLTCSAFDGSGLADVWQAISDHRRFLTDSDQLEGRRRRQRVAWMWAAVDDALQLAVRDHPAVADRMPSLELAVERGERTAADAAAEILELFNRGATGATGRTDRRRTP